MKKENTKDSDCRGHDAETFRNAKTIGTDHNGIQKTGTKVGS
ncbi:MAG: hypothetical protein RLZZ142_925 [Verrucomicrobiota bacterium]|jgi:hypothetical protein